MGKKRKAVLALLLIGGFLLSSTAQARTGINANEQELIEFFQNGIEYNGQHYSIPVEYINQGINYLKQPDVDITDEQKQKIYAKVVEMTPTGIEQGYLKLDEPAPTTQLTITPAPEAPTPEKENTSENSEEQSVPMQAESETPEAESSSGNHTTQDREKETRKENKSVSQVITSVKDLSDDLGVQIAYDADQHHINVTNEKGKTVMKADKVIKNTGFLLNQSIFIGAGLFVLLGICMEVARRHQLFAHYDEE